MTCRVCVLREFELSRAQAEVRRLARLASREYERNGRINNPEAIRQAKAFAADNKAQLDQHAAECQVIVQAAA